MFFLYTVCFFYQSLSLSTTMAQDNVVSAQLLQLLCYLLEINTPERQTWKPWACPRALGFLISEPQKPKSPSHLPCTHSAKHMAVCASPQALWKWSSFLLACPVPATDSPLLIIQMWNAWKTGSCASEMLYQVWQHALAPVLQFSIDFSFMYNARISWNSSSGFLSLRPCSLPCKKKEKMYKMLLCICTVLRLLFAHLMFVNYNDFCLIYELWKCASMKCKVSLSSLNKLIIPL